jgi:hypothetical protein
MTTKLQTMKERLAQAADWNSVGEDDIASHIPREQADALKARQRQEEAHLAYLRVEQEKARLQRMQYEASNKALLDALIGDDATVAHLEDETEKAQAALDALYLQYAGVCQRVRELANADEIDLTTADPATLVETAIQRRRAIGEEAVALGAVKLELERRIRVSEAGLGEQRSDLHRVKRSAVHRYCDQKIAELRPHLEVVNKLFKELTNGEEMIRGLGGQRQVFSNARTKDTIAFSLERWDVELAEIHRFSEQYDTFSA